MQASDKWQNSNLDPCIDKIILSDLNMHESFSQSKSIWRNLDRNTGK